MTPRTIFSCLTLFLMGAAGAHADVLDFDVLDFNALQVGEEVLG